MIEESTKRLTLRVSEDFHREVRVECAKRGIPIAEIIRQLLRMWLEGQIELPDDH